MNKLPYDKRHLKFGNSSAVLEPKILELLKQFSPNVINILYDANIAEKFCASYLNWIKETTLNTFRGLERYPYACYTNGTTESFDRFYAKNNTRRFRCFRGEYMYHQLSWRNNYSWKFIEDDNISSNDAIVISLPFSDTGNEHSDMKVILKKCSELKVPVLVDCAYFGICSNIDFDLTQECITDVVFSLSKSFPVAHARIGMRLTKEDNDDPLFVVNKSGYINRLGVALGQKLIDNFSSDYIPLTYKETQKTMCKHLGVVQSNTVLFGIAGDAWNEYNRGNTTNRLSFHNYLHLPLENFYNDC